MNRVIWSEGLFLRPQHFQQHDRFIESFVEGRAGSLRTSPWGFVEVEIERDLLHVGKIGLRSARGVFPDGTPFSVPDNDLAPPPLDISAQIRDQIVYLAVPLRQAGATLSDAGSGARGFTRYRIQDMASRDVSKDSGASADIEVECLNLRLMMQSERGEDFARIPLAHVLECRSDKQVLLEDRFIPSVLRSGAAPRLSTYLSEVQGLLYQRAEALAARAVASGRGGTSEIVEFLLLQAINRYEPLITHLAATGNAHPEDLFAQMLQIAGELSTLTTPSRRPPKFPVYQHENIRPAFEAVMAQIRQCFLEAIGSNVVEIPLLQKKFGMRVGKVADPSLFDSAVFVLAARADVASEDFRRRFPAQCKIGPIDKIVDLVNLALPGIAMQAMPVAPRQLHNIAGSHYFELERGTELWRALKSSGGIAIHQAGDFPGLSMECWAIRG